MPGHRRSPAASTTINPAMRGCAARRSSVCSSNGLLPIGRYCFGISPPTRLLRPAAGTTHHSTDSVVIVGLLVAGLRFDDLIENLAGLDQAKFGTRAFLDCILAGFQILHFRGECFVALLQLLVLELLLGQPPLEPPDVAHAALAGPKFDFQRDQ